MGKIIDNVLKNFGQTVELIKNAKTDLMSGEMTINDIESLTGTEITAAIVKRKVELTQVSDGRMESFPSYIMVDPSINLENEDVIKTTTEFFFVHEVSLRHNNIAGLNSSPEYKRAELELYK